MTSPDYPCTNPNCHSYGQPHPNCRCQPPQGYAIGGAVHFCGHGHPHAATCEHFAEGGEVQDNLEFQNNPGLAVDHAVTHHGLSRLLGKPGHTHKEFLKASRHGRQSLKAYSDSMLDPKARPMKPDDNKAQALQSRLDELRSNPDAALSLGGELGDALPFHSAALAAKAATTMSYLDGIKPKPVAGGPLDKPTPVGKLESKNYQRQLAIAENPGLIFQHAKDGTLRPSDMQTLSTLYPKLRANVQDRALETMTNARSKGQELTQSQKRKFGPLLGQPLTFQQSPAAVQAILHANAPQLPMPAPPKQKKASGVELKQINQVNELSKTPLQKLQTDK